MKQTVFFASWKDYALTKDTSMTRNRMARLLKAWRNAQRQGIKEFDLRKIGPHYYRVATTKYYNNEWHFVKWQ